MRVFNVEFEVGAEVVTDEVKARNASEAVMVVARDHRLPHGAQVRVWEEPLVYEVQAPVSGTRLMGREVPE